MRFGTGYINMGGVKMESSKIISFSDKSTLIPLFEKYKNKKGTFRFIDDTTLELKIEFISNSYNIIRFLFKRNLNYSLCMKKYYLKNKKIICEYVEDIEIKDIENRKVEFVDFYFEYSFMDIMLKMELNTMILNLDEIVTAEFMEGKV